MTSKPTQQLKTNSEQSLNRLSSDTDSHTQLNVLPVALPLETAEAEMQGATTMAQVSDGSVLVNIAPQVTLEPVNVAPQVTLESVNVGKISPRNQQALPLPLTLALPKLVCYLW